MAIGAMECNLIGRATLLGLPCRAVERPSSR
jgi:hypothetical protein